MCKLHILLLSQLVSLFLTSQYTNLFHKPVCILNSSVNDLLNSLRVTFITMTCIALRVTIKRSKVCIGPSGPRYLLHHTTSCEVEATGELEQAKVFLLQRHNVR